MDDYGEAPKPDRLIIPGRAYALIGGHMVEIKDWQMNTLPNQLATRRARIEDAERAVIEAFEGYDGGD